MTSPISSNLPSVGGTYGTGSVQKPKENEQQTTAVTAPQGEKSPAEVKDDNKTATYKQADLPNSLPVSFTPKSQQAAPTELSEENMALLEKISNDPRLSKLVGSMDLYQICDFICKNKGGNGGVKFFLNSLDKKLINNDMEGLKKDIISGAKTANLAFNSQIKGPERFDPSLSPAQAKKIAEEETELDDLGKLWGQQLDFDFGFGIGSGNPEAQTGGTPTTTTNPDGTTTTTPAKKPTIGDLLTQKLLGFGIHVNYDSHKKSTGIQVPKWMLQELKFATSEDDVTKIMTKIINHLKTTGQIPENAGTGETQTGGGKPTGEQQTGGGITGIKIGG